MCYCIARDRLPLASHSFYISMHTKMRDYLCERYLQECDSTAIFGIGCVAAYLG